PRYLLRLPVARVPQYQAMMIAVAPLSCRQPLSIRAEPDDRLLYKGIDGMDRQILLQALSGRSIPQAHGQLSMLVREDRQNLALRMERTIRCMQISHQCIRRFS